MFRRGCIAFVPFFVDAQFRCVCVWGIIFGFEEKTLPSLETSCSLGLLRCFDAELFLTEL